MLPSLITGFLLQALTLSAKSIRARDRHRSRRANVFRATTRLKVPHPPPLAMTRTPLLACIYSVRVFRSHAFSALGLACSVLFPPLLPLPTTIYYYYLLLLSTIPDSSLSLYLYPSTSIPLTLRDSDIWEIYARLCVNSTLDHISRAANVDDADIESVNPGYSQPAYR